MEDILYRRHPLQRMSSSNTNSRVGFTVAALEGTLCFNVTAALGMKQYSIVLKVAAAAAALTGQNCHQPTDKMDAAAK